MRRKLTPEQKKFLLWTPVLFIVCVIVWLFFSILSASDQKENGRKETISGDSPKAQMKKQMANDPLGKKVAEQFLQAYINFDTKNPDRQLKQLEPFVTLGFLEKVKDTKRGTAEFQSSRFLSIEKSDYEKIQEHGEQKIIWTFQALEEVTDAKGSKIKEENSYAAHLIQIDGSWKVFEVEIHGTFD